MTAFNVVRMRVKPGNEEAYIRAHNERSLAEMKGMRALHLIRTGEREFCLIGEWTDMAAMAAARPAMIATLDTFRDRLEDLGQGLGVTDPVSGEVVVERRP
jgi:quinol monooxygenase YgiN